MSIIKAWWEKRFNVHDTSSVPVFHNWRGYDCQVLAVMIAASCDDVCNVKFFDDAVAPVDSRPINSPSMNELEEFPGKLVWKSVGKFTDITKRCRLSQVVRTRLFASATRSSVTAAVVPQCCWSHYGISDGELAARVTPFIDRRPIIAIRFRTIEFDPRIESHLPIPSIVSYHAEEASA